MPIQESTTTRIGQRTIVSLVVGLSVIAVVIVAVAVSRSANKATVVTPYVCPNIAVSSEQRANDYQPGEIVDLESIMTALRTEASPQLGRKDTGISPTVGHLLEQRKRALIEAIEQSPEVALDELTTNEERDWFRSVTRGCVEQAATMTGRLEIVHADRDDGMSEEFYTLLPPAGAPLRLFPARHTRAYLSGQQVTLTGFEIDGRFLYDEEQQSFPNEVRALSVGSQTTGPQKVLVLMANFSNTDQPMNTWDSVYNVIFNPTERSVYAHYLEGSWGKTPLTGALNARASEGKEGDIFGWYQLDETQNCDVKGVAQRAMIKAQQAEQAAGRDIDFSQYHYVITVAPFSCGWGGLATLGANSYTTPDGAFQYGGVYVPSRKNIYDGVNTRLVGHELGHAFGNHHADFLDCKTVSIKASGCTPSSQWDYYDIMGKSTEYDRPRHFNAIHKEIVGWFDSSRVLQTVTPQTVTADGRYTLGPMESDVAANETQIKALKIKRTATDFLYVEYRQPIGFDVNMDFDGQGNPFAGAIIHTGPYDLLSYLIDADVPTGSTPHWINSTLTTTTTDPATGQSGFVDPVSGVRIRVTDNAVNADAPANSRLTVEVAFPGGAAPAPAPAPTAPPTPTIPPEPNQPPPTGGAEPSYLLATPARKSTATIRVFDQSLNLAASFQAFSKKMSAGATVAAGDTNGDGSVEVIAGTAAGSVPRLRIFTLAGTLVKELLPLSTKDRSGLQVATGDIDGDGRTEIFATPLKGGAPRIIVYRYDTATSQYRKTATFTAIRGNYRDGLNLTTADTDGDGRAELIVTPAGKGDPIVRIFGSTDAITFRLKKTFRVFSSKDRFGLSAAVADVDGDRAPELVFVRGQGATPTIRVFSPSGKREYSFEAASREYKNGVVVSTFDRDADGLWEIVTAVASNGPPNCFFFEYNPATHRFERVHILPVFSAGARDGLRISSS